MGSRKHEAVGRARAHEVVVLGAAGGETRPCAVAFTRYGAEFSDGPAAVLRVPWWTIRGFAPEDARDPSVRRLDLVTDAGALTVLVAAGGFDDLLDDLGHQATRWRVLRFPPVAATSRALTVVRVAVARSQVVRRANPAWLAIARVAAHGRDRGRVALASVARTRLGGFLGRPFVRPALVVIAVLGVTASAGATLSSARGRTPAAQHGAVAVASTVTATQDAASGWWGIAETMKQARLDGLALRLAKAEAPPPPAPPSVADEPPLSPHEEFGFVPYWGLSQASAIDVSGFTTLAYFSVSANSNGTLDQSGAGWDGYESQDFADLVARAHDAGDRVVLTVECFTQPQLTALTTSAAAASTLAAQILQAVSSKNLDGVNIDFEGDGNRDGLTALVTTVSSVLHAANPHYQVTVDTDASSAAGPDGFYDVPALAGVADGLFVMAYGENVSSSPTSASPITSNEYSDAEAAAQYAAAAPPGKVIFGLPYFGYVWPTTDGTMSAAATGTGAGISDATALASGHPVYWDPITDSAWTSYEVGSQWYEAYFTDPASIYLMTELAQRSGFAGVGAWALGMDGDSAAMTAALDGNAPAVRAGPAGPASTSMSAPASKPKPNPAAGQGAAPAPAIPPPPPTTTTTAPAQPPGGAPTTTTTTVPGSTGGSRTGATGMSGEPAPTPGGPGGATSKTPPTDAATEPTPPRTS